MNAQDLKQALAVGGGTLTLSRELLGGLLATCYQDVAPVITGAAPGPGDGVDGTVVLTGKSSFLSVADVPVTARFSVGADGQVRALLTYRLRDDAPGPQAWTFSRSFPTLPAVWDYSTGFPTHDNGQTLGSVQRPYVEALDLLDTCYVVSTHAGKDPDTGIPLEPGLNFVSRMRPQGMTGVLEATLSDSKPLTLYGPVRIPRETDRTLALLPRQRPWERSDAPGIHLKSDLALDFKVGPIAFTQAALRIYSPHSTDWWTKNPTFSPIHGYSGRLSIASAGIDLDLSADLEWGLPRAFLYSRCEGMKLSKLAQLVDLTGTGDLTSALPDELRSAVEKLGALELIDIGVSVGLNDKLLPTAEAVSVTVGFPQLSWKVFGDTLEVKSLSCRFDVTDPFGKPSVAVQLMGTLEIEGVPLSVMARKDKDWTLYAKLDGAQTIPLTKLMKTYAPSVPPPSDLTVQTLAVSVNPGKSYGMSARLGDQPKPWVVPLGRSNITLGNVLLDFVYRQGGQVTGAFSGTASFGKTLSLSVGLGIPGSFAIRGTFPKVNLTQLIEELCDVKTPLPGGFDLVLENTSVLVQGKDGNYTFRAATSVKDFGLLAFEVRKIPGRGWGFATGMDLGGAGLSKLPGLGGLKSIEDSFKLQKLMLVVSSFEDASFTFPDLAQFNQPRLGAGSLALPAQASGVIPGLMLFAQWQLDDNSREQKLLKSLLGLGGTQSVALAIGADPTKDFRLYVSSQGTIQKQPFQYKMGVQLTNGKPSYFLTGSLTTRMQGQPQTFDLTTVFVPGGAMMAATVKGGTAIDCGPFKLSNLALQMGVNWAGIPSLGIAATIDVKKFESSVAAFFDSTDPSRSLVAGSITSLTARDVLETLVGGNLNSPLDDVLKTVAIKGTHQFTLPGDVAGSLDALELDKVATAFAGAKVTIPSSSSQLLLVVNTKGAAWHLTDLTTMRHYELKKAGDKVQACVSPQFYFAPQPTYIGTLKFPQGFYLNAAISFAGFDASATIDISQNKGISVDAQMDKIQILDEKLFSLAALQGGGGPRISISTFSQPDNPVQVFRPPHFYINGALTMLGVKQGLYAGVTVQGIDFELVGRLVPGVNFDLTARFGKSGVSANGKVKVGVGTVDLGPLGKAKVNTELDVAVDVDIDNGARTVSVDSGPSWSGDATLLSNEFGRLVFQGDGNLVLYRTSGTSWEPLWASGTNGRGGNQVAFQGDGNLVIYANGRPVWASNTNGQGVSKLTLRSDGNVVLTDGSGNVRWQTGTAGRGAGASIELESSFVFAGQHIDLGRFHAEVTADAFTQLPTIVSKKVEAALRDVFKDATKWANAVSNGVMDGVNDTAKVFQDVYGKSEKEAKALANSMNKGVNQATQAVENTAKDVGKSVESTAKDIGKGAEKTAKKAYKKVKFW